MSQLCRVLCRALTLFRSLPCRPGRSLNDGNRGKIQGTSSSASNEIKWNKQAAALLNMQHALQLPDLLKPFIFLVSRLCCH